MAISMQLFVFLGNLRPINNNYIETGIPKLN